MAYQQQQTRAITVAGKAQQALDDQPIDPRIAMAAKAIQLMAGQNDDGSPKISADMAIAVAMYQAGTGQQLGRDFYVDPRLGHIDGYRGVARDAVDRGIGDVQIKYRPLTTDEVNDNGIAPGDTAVVCEVYQLRVWRAVQAVGERYSPVLGIGVVREIEKFSKKSTQRWDNANRRYEAAPRSEWIPITLEGGMTWHKKAGYRAYKAALRQTPGAAISGDEVIADALASGRISQPPPQHARLSVEQAEAWVDAARETPSDNKSDLETRVTQMRGPASFVGFGDDEIIDAEFDALPSASAPDDDGESVWADWSRPEHAIAWAMTQGVFDHQRHAENAYAKVKTDCQPKKAADMWQCWYNDVQRRIAEKQDAGHHYRR